MNDPWMFVYGFTALELSSIPSGLCLWSACLLVNRYLAATQSYEVSVGKPLSSKPSLDDEPAADHALIPMSLVAACVIGLIATNVGAVAGLMFNESLRARHHYVVETLSFACLIPVKFVTVYLILLLGYSLKWNRALLVLLIYLILAACAAAVITGLMLAAVMAIWAFDGGIRIT